MNRTILARLLTRTALISGLAALACAPMASAGTGIVKCVAGDGRVTLTDESCAANERSVTVVAAGAPAPAPTISADAQRTASEPSQASGAAAPTVARTVQMTRARLPSGGIVRNSLARFDPPSRSLARDVSTLKAARQAMHLLDSAASSMRAQRIAGLR